MDLIVIQQVIFQYVPGVPKKLSSFEQFHSNNNCLVLNDVNNNLCLKALLDPYNFPDFFAHQKRPPKYGFFKNGMLEEVLEKVGNLAIGDTFHSFHVLLHRCAGIYLHVSFSQIGIQCWQYAKVQTIGPCLAYYTFSSNMKQNHAFYRQNRQIRFFWVPLCS